jgi:hypothetical protein
MGIIYGLVDSRDLLIHYVGKSRNGLSRANRHWHNHSKHHGHRCAAWIDDMKASGAEVVAVVLDVIDDDRLSAAERWWIGYGVASGWPLTNATCGGNAGDAVRTLTAEHRAKIAASIAGLGQRHPLRDPAIRERHAARMKDHSVVAKFSGDNNPMRRDEQRAKARQRQLNNPSMQAQLSAALASRWAKDDGKFSRNLKDDPKRKARMAAALASRWAKHRLRKLCSDVSTFMRLSAS